MARPYFKAIFEEELNGWHRREREWPARRTYETFLAWFEVEVHSMVIDLPGYYPTSCQIIVDQVTRLDKRA
jgi:hypothetical protein